jgi:hypothetical protein
MSKALETFKGLPGWAKGTIAVGVLAIITAVGYTIYKNRQAKKKAEDALANTLVIKDELDELRKKGVNPIYAQSQYVSWADKIETDFAGCDPGYFKATSIEQMKNILIAVNEKYYSNSGITLLNIIKNFKSDADFKALKLGWNGQIGTRTYDKCGIWNGNFTGTLNQAVADELTETEITGINTVLKSLNINDKF